MLLGGLRARANNLVPTRRPQNSATAKPSKPRPLAAQVATKAEAAEVTETEKKGMLGGLDIPLLAYFFFWYLGNYYYNISNKTALKAAGGALGYPMTISTLQLGVGSLYALFLWAAPDARSPPAGVPPPRLCRPHATHLGTQALRAQATGQGEPAVRGAPAAVLVLLARLELPTRLHGPVAPAAAQDRAQVRRLAPPQRRPVRHAAPPVGVAAADGPTRELREPQGPAGRPRPRAARCGALETTRPQDPSLPAPQGAALR